MSERISFGPFTLVADERRLLRSGVPVELGARAFDVLSILASRPNEVVSKKELMAAVWSDVTVDEGSLRFHMTNLRKALGDGHNGARYIATVTGRGYCLAMPTTRSGYAAPHANSRSPSVAGLPSRSPGMLGREEDVAKLLARLEETRFVTLVGTGGVGKTTVAVSVGHDLIESFDGGAYFIDLGALGEPEFVATTVASMLGLSLEPQTGFTGLLAYLAPRRVLLILDTCEHVIDAAAELAERIFAAAPQVHILATSREPLGILGENVFRLAPLPCPPDDFELTPERVRDYPATRLFLERAAASGASLSLDDGDAEIVADICRKLDGVPLAIELAAGRVASYGLQKTATLLDESLPLLWPGQRTAPTRQKTLQATLDWSYRLLSITERLLLRRLAVFAGSFSVEAALDVVADQALDEAGMLRALDGLVAKSLIATRPDGAKMRYRLLDTTRFYALQLDTSDAERNPLALRHADHCLRWLKETGGAWRRLSSASERSLHLNGLANVRAALVWCFARDTDRHVGIQLAVAAAPVFLSMSLLTECHRWTALALNELKPSRRSSREEMHLQSALGVSMMFTRGGREAAGEALNRSLILAEDIGGPLDRLQVLGPLQMFHLRTGSFRHALAYAERCAQLAGSMDDPVSATLAQSLMGISHHLGGDLTPARDALEAALRHGSRARRSTSNFLGFDGQILAGSILARTLWLQGHSDAAMQRASLTIEDAEALGHPLTLSIALVWVASLLLWAGDLDAAGEMVDRLLDEAEIHSLRPYLSIGLGFRGEIAIRSGDGAAGTRALQSSLAELYAAPYELVTTPLNIALIQGFAATNRFAEAHGLADETIHAVRANGDTCYLPELLRLKGTLFFAAPQDEQGSPEAYLEQALELARYQGARAWELRTAVDLADLLVERGDEERARNLLRPLQHSQGADLNIAGRLLARIS